MKCPDREQLFAYAQRLMDPREDAVVRAHVEACAGCRAVLEEYRQLDAVLEEWQPVEPSEWFDARVRRAVEAGRVEKPSASFLGLQWAHWLALASLAVAVGVGAWMFLGTRRPSSAPRPVARTSAPQVTAPQPQAVVAQTTPATEDNAQRTEATTTHPVMRSAEDELSADDDLKALEDYDMLANFDVLSELAKRETKVAN